MTRQARWDIFLSYSYRDRDDVLAVVRDLSKANIRVWYDDWEMNPGDVLRERIQAGIANSTNMLVYLSPSSLKSNWVRNELNSAMIREIEDGEVRVIPALAPGVELRHIPLDLRAKVCLSFADPESCVRSVQKLVQLVRPEIRLRREQVARIRDNQDGFDSVGDFAKYITDFGDQAISIAAMKAVRKIGGSEAVVVLTRRALGVYGVNAIKTAHGLLLAMEDEGGLLGLASTYPADSRYWREKLAVFARYDRGLQHYLSLDGWQLGQGMPSVMQSLYASTTDDIKFGARLSCLYRDESEMIPLATNNEILDAIHYAQLRVPGLVDMLRPIS